MILRHECLAKHPRVFYAMTGLSLLEFDDYAEEFLPRFRAADRQRLQRPGRRRAPGGGLDFTLGPLDQLLAVIVWLRHYPTNEVLGYLLGVSDSTVSRCVARVLPLVEALGLQSLRLPDPKTARRKALSDLLRETPELAVVIDSFEQRVQRPQAPLTERQPAAGGAAASTPPGDRKPEQAAPGRPADRWYRGKKKQHTIKSQVAVDETDGRLVAVSPSVPGPTADIELLRQSGLMAALPEGVGGLGDLAYVGIAKLAPNQSGATPRRKPRGKPRPEQDQDYNRAFARRRIVVEHGIARLRKYQALTQTDRHHREKHQSRVRAVAGLVNHQIKHRRPH
jgi:DDE superfamily endonuclease/Helix-turn-helix of DDE superfamily endonuclease